MATSWAVEWREWVGFADLCMLATETDGGFAQCANSGVYRVGRALNTMRSTMR